MLPWWVRLPIRMLPRTFRDRFGADLAQSITALAAVAYASGGRRRRLAYLAAETVGLWRLAISRRTYRQTLDTPAANGAPMTAGLFDDLRWAVRHAKRRPIFSLAVIVTLSVAIGGAASAFGIADAVLWRPLPFDDAGRLVFVWEESEREGQPAPSRVTGARFAAWRDVDSGLASISLFGAAGFTVDDDGGAASIRGVRVSANYFDTLGIRAALGRTFTADDEVPGSHRVVILSHRVWQQRFGRRPDAVGSLFRLNGQPYVIVGVMPPATFPAWPVNPAIVTLDAEARDVWVPIPRTPALDQNGRAHVFGVLARLGDGVSGTDAAARLDLTSGATAVDPHRARLAPLREQLTAGARASLLVLGAAALAVLLIACANLAALYASLFESRRAELAVRTAIGAGSARLARQLLLETSLLAACGATGGLLIARAALGAIPGAVPAAVPLLTSPSVDWRVSGAAIALALLATAILTGWPVARVFAAAPAPRGVAPRPRMSVYRTLVVAQVAITVALASAAGLLMRSLDSIRMQDPGFSAERVLVADIGLPSSAPGEPGLITLAERSLIDAVAAVPRVRAVATAYDHPLEANWSESPTVVGDATHEERRQQVELRIVSPGYFDALGVEMLNGRPFTEREGMDAPGVAVVNEAYAREIGGTVIGRRIRTGTPRFNFTGAPEEFEVVGIAGNERVRGLEEAARPAFYLSTRQFPQTSFVMLVRTAADPILLAGDVRAAVRASGAGITFDRPTSLEAVLDGQLAPRQMTTVLVGGLASAALVLAALGMYGLLAVLVESQRREIGVRLAIGATPASVSRQVMIGSLRNAGAGVGLGCAAALLAGQLLQSLLAGVSAHDPINLATAAGMLLAIAVGASVLPAVRAARVDPVEALRAD
jgi:predicted permease